MRDVIRDLDRLLRGRFSERGTDAATIPIERLLQGALALGVVYGLFMGLYAGLRTEHPTYLQVAVSAVKVPLLFLLTLVVTFPSLYVFSALRDSPLRGPDTLRLLLAAVTVNLALLASFGPVTGFFTLSTDSYPFMVVLNVTFFVVSGLVGLSFLRRSLANLFADSALPPAPIARAAPGTEGAELDEPADPDQPAVPEGGAAPAEPGAMPGSEAPGDLDAAAHAWRRRAREESAVAHERRTSSLRVFRVWIVIYAVVGAQMAWILRPFIGTPSREFALFRPRDSHFFAGVWHAVQALFR